MDEDDSHDTGMAVFLWRYNYCQTFLNIAHHYLEHCSTSVSLLNRNRIVEVVHVVCTVCMFIFSCCK